MSDGKATGNNGKDATYSSQSKRNCILRKQSKIWPPFVTDLTFSF